MIKFTTEYLYPVHTISKEDGNNLSYQYATNSRLEINFTFNFIQILFFHKIRFIVLTIAGFAMLFIHNMRIFLIYGVLPLQDTMQDYDIKPVKNQKQ